MIRALERYEPAPLPSGQMRSYTGTRRADGGTHVTRFMAGRGEPLNARLDLRNHSPTGFEWGYGGSGPAQLALALCCDALGDDARALASYQRFKFGVVAALPKAGWTLTRAEIVSAVEEIEAQRAISGAPGETVIDGEARAND